MISHTQRISLALGLIILTGCAEKEYVTDTIDVTSNLSFDANVSKTNYRVNRPGLVVEGNGHTIDGICNTDCIGLTINANNVTVRNLTIKRFDGGVSIKPGVTGVKFENITIVDNVNHGVFVNVGVSNFSCDRCDISDNGSMGLYFEYNSFGNSISNSRIANNGYRDKDTGNWIENLKADAKDKREGLAIDASQGNSITNSVFTGNALTGITMYKNCGERGIRRDWGANYNTVSNSTFHDGIHVAARQDKDLSSWTCVDPYVWENKYIMDEAEFNVLENITLIGNAKIRIQDDNNIVQSVTGGEIIVSSTVRQALNLPISGVETRDVDSVVANVFANQ